MMFCFPLVSIVSTVMFSSAPKSSFDFTMVTSKYCAGPFKLGHLVGSAGRLR